MIPATKQTVLVGYGKVTFSSVSASFASFVVRPKFDRTTAGQSGRASGNKQVAQAGQFAHQGTLINQMTMLDDGAVVLVTSRWTRNGSPVRDGAIFLRLRARAAYYSIVAVVPVHRDSVCGDRFTMFAGHADLLGSDELSLLGIEPPPVYVAKFMQPEEIDECFEINQMVAEVEPPPTQRVVEIVTPAGVEERIVTSSVPRRRIQLRRGG